MRLALGAALLVSSGIATLIEAAANHPIPADPGGYYLMGDGTGGNSAPTPAMGWSPDVYAASRAVAFALLVFGATLLVLALVREVRR